MDRGLFEGLEVQKDLDSNLRNISVSGMGGASELEQRLTFLDLGRDDVALLEELGPVLERHADTFVAAFYRHLLSFAPTRELLGDPSIKERLFITQREYLLSLSKPSLDEAFLANRRQIGESHQRVGLKPCWYLGAYSLYFTLLAPIVRESFPGDPERAAETLVALQKLLSLDAQIAIDAYIVRREHDLEYLTHELESAGRRLDREYRDQTAELQRTIERAESAEQLASIGTLVAGLAHEIGTPMGVIQGHAKLLESTLQKSGDNIGSSSAWRLQTIREQISRISKIMQTLLNLARPSKAKRVLVDLEPIIEATLSFLGEKISGRDIRVARTLKPVPKVSGDPERLQQLFLNLFLNAADAMPNGGVLGIKLDHSEGAPVRVCITDTGVGIAASDLALVFDPFFTSKAAGEGNGLGLMVANNIVSHHDGKIEVTSAVGRGTEFCISLPVPTAEL